MSLHRHQKTAFRWIGAALTLLASHAAAGLAAELSLSSAEAPAASTVVLPVRLAASANTVSALQFDLVYDADVLSISAHPGESARVSEKMVYTAEPRSGLKRFLLVGFNTTSMADGTVVALFINVAAGADGPRELRLSNAIASDGGGTPVALTTVDGQIAIRGSAVLGLGAEGVLNAASLLPGPVAAGELITIIGPRIAVPDVSVRFDGLDAPILYAEGSQINALAPAGLDGRQSARLEVSGAGVLRQLTLSVVPAAPGVFTQGSSGTGDGAILNEDGSLNSPANPCARGSLVSIYGTGVPVDGVLAEIGGKPAAVSAVEQVAPGVVQVRVRVPEDLAVLTGALVFLQSGQARSQPGVTIWAR